MEIRLPCHSLSQYLWLCSMVFYRIKPSKFVKYHPFFYYLLSFIYVGEVVGTSEAAKVVLGGTLCYPQGWLPAVVEPLRTTKRTHSHVGWYWGSAQLTGSEFWCMCRDAVGIRGNFSKHIGSHIILGQIRFILVSGACLGHTRLCKGYSSISSCSTWPSRSTTDPLTLEGAPDQVHSHIHPHTTFLFILFPRFGFLVAHPIHSYPYSSLYKPLS